MRCWPTWNVEPLLFPTFWCSVKASPELSWYVGVFQNTTVEYLRRSAYCFCLYGQVMTGCVTSVKENTERLLPVYCFHDRVWGVDVSSFKLYNQSVHQFDNILINLNDNQLYLHNQEVYLTIFRLPCILMFVQLSFYIQHHIQFYRRSCNYVYLNMMSVL